MRVLRRAPMLAVLAGLVSGAAMFDRAGGFVFVIAPVVYAAVMLCSYEVELPGEWRVFGVGVVICLLCSLRMYSVMTSPPSENITLVKATGTVSSVRTWGRIYAAIIDVDSGGRYVARRQFMDMMPGDRIAFDGVTQRWRPRYSDSNFDEARFWGARGVEAWVSLANVQDLPERFSLARMRYVLSRKLTMYMPQAVGAYLKAAWIGDRDELLTRMHRRWGTVHLLAVSGFHVGIVVLCASFVFGKRPMILSVIMWLYILLTGAAPSALRAGLMLQVALIARALGRPDCRVNSVSVAGVFILMYSPLMFWDIGFRLSMLAAMVIATLPRKKYMWLLISPLVSLVTFPQVSFTFGSIVLVGLVTNIVAPLYFTFALTIASAFGILRLLGVPMMSYALFAVEGIFLLWERSADFVAELIPYSLTWHYLIAWVGTGTLIYCLCRYFRLDVIRIIAVMISGSVLAFVMFL